MKKIVTIFLFVLLLTLSACAPHIEDENGEDTSLATFDLYDDIKEGTTSSRMSTSSTTSSGGVTHSFLYEEIDYNYIKMNVKILSGITKVNATDMTNYDRVVLTITSTLSSGNLEIVVVDEFDNLVQTVEINQTVTVTIDDTEDTEYYVVVGGESAEFMIEVERELFTLE